MRGPLGSEESKGASFSGRAEIKRFGFRLAFFFFGGGGDGFRVFRDFEGF